MADPRPVPPRAAIRDFCPCRKPSAVSMDAHPSARERAALRCVYFDATILADQVTERIALEHTVRGRVTERGIEMRAVAKTIVGEGCQQRFRAGVREGRD